MCCSPHSKEHRLWLGLVAFIIGAVVLLQKFELIPITTWDYLWPTLLIVVGLKLLIGSRENCDDGSCCDDACACDMPSMPMVMEKKAPKSKAKKK
ncbi:MAG: DUF5668 domain-containing protein [Patescibacteria group bacterium]